MPFLSSQVSYFITFSGIQNSWALSSSPIWFQFPVAADDQEAVDGYDLLAKGSRLAVILKRAWRVSVGEWTPQHCQRHAESSGRYSVWQYLLLTLEELIFNWASLNFMSFISLAKPVQKTSVSVNVCQTDTFMQSLHVPWAAQHIPQTPIISVRKLSSCATSYSRMKVGLQNNQHSPLAHLSYVTFAHRWHAGA